jgi:hypothetical protein
MTTATMINYTVNPVWTALKAFGRGTLNVFESLGRARAAAELHRLGYTKEAKALMLQEYK